MSDILYNLVSWNSFKRIIKQHFNIDFIKIDDFFKDETEWHQFEGWEDATEIDILNGLSELELFEGQLLVITDASYNMNQSPFLMNAEQLLEFAERHKNNFGELFLDTDILIISLEKRLVWIFHHEGVYGVVEYN